MPIYEYSCGKCGQTSEFILSSRSVPEDLECPECGGRDLRKLISSLGSVSVSSPRSSENTCCDRTERCDTPPCSVDGSCQKD